jgi:adenylate cyclase
MPRIPATTCGGPFGRPGGVYAVTAKAYSPLSVAFEHPSLLSARATPGSAGKAIAAAATAELQRIDPNLSIGFAQCAVALITLGRFEEALAQVDQGLTSDPSGPDVAYLMRQKCKAYSYMGQYEKAIPTCEKAATLKEMMSPYLFLTADFAQLGEMDKAASAKARLLKLDPGFSLARFRPGAATIAPHPAWVQQAETYVIPGLRKAGIPEK